jgi:hypothetical protein
MITNYHLGGYPALLVKPYEPERFIGAALTETNGRIPYPWDLLWGYRELGKGAEWQEADVIPGATLADIIVPHRFLAKCWPQ